LSQAVGTASTTPSEPAAPVASSPETPATTSTQQAQSILSELRQRDPQFAAQFSDDSAALNYLLSVQRQYQQQQPLVQYGQQYVRHANDFQAFMAQKQEEARLKAEREKSWFKAPEYDPNWVHALERDVNGNLQVKAGHNPEILQKYHAANQHSRSFLEKFAFDPVGAIKPGLEQITQEIVARAVQEQLQAFQERQQANSFLEKNAAWMHAKDQQGNVLVGQNGMPVLGPWGRRFAEHVQEAANLGMLDTDRQSRYAMRMIQADMALAAAQPQQAAAQQQQSNQNFIAQHRPNGTSGSTGVDGMTLAERMKVAFEAAGIK
jgi:hypothetical protein